MRGTAEAKAEAAARRRNRRRWTLILLPFEDGWSYSGPRQAEVRAQRFSFVFGSEQSAALQDRNDLGNEHVEHFRQDRRHQVEPISHAAADPVLHEIGHLLRRSFEHEMAARAGELCQQLAKRRAMLSDKSDDHLGAAA